jgi:hypothetical protein
MGSFHLYFFATDFLVCIAISGIILKVNSGALSPFKWSQIASIRKWRWGIIISGAIIPWVTALGVWIILQVKGMPVASLGDAAITMLFFGFPATIVFVFPYVFLAEVAKFVLQRSFIVDAEMKRFEKKLTILIGLIGGLVATTFMTYFLWQKVSEAFLGIILGFYYIISFNVGGIIVGILAASIAIAAKHIIDRRKKKAVS